VLGNNPLGNNSASCISESEFLSYEAKAFLKLSVNNSFTRKDKEEIINGLRNIARYISGVENTNFLAAVKLEPDGVPSGIMVLLHSKELADILKEQVENCWEEDESESEKSYSEQSESEKSYSEQSESEELNECSAFGYKLRNKPNRSAGCGSNSSLEVLTKVENGEKFTMNVDGRERELYITLPVNYDNSKPYKILFAMLCLGSTAEDFVHHNPDQDHPSPYYGQRALDKNNDYIFVAPGGDTYGHPWSTTDDRDHKFFGQLLTLLEDNYCIDQSRVFVTGYEFGAMVTNSLAQAFQHRIRAVAVYAVADYNIYLPKNAGKPIAWMAVHGKGDTKCSYDRAKSSAVKRILKYNGVCIDETTREDVSDEIPEEVGDNGHLCYDFQTVDPRFPVKFCSWNGGNQWTAYDSGNWQNSWVPEAVHDFFEQF